MQCNQCKSEIESGEEREHMGQVLCEDCLMEALSPVKACDPWAVYSAKSMTDDGVSLSKLQQNILSALKETDGMEPKILAEKMGIDVTELERELATLRHMEKIRATKQGGRKLICLW